jgi:peptidoglycan/xylan/chitin deacetylase (PgdA/CDA1 family)
MNALYLQFKFRRNAFILSMAGIAAAVVLLVWMIGRPVLAVSAQQTSDTVEVPIIMYHSLLKDPKLQGKYVISPDVFENDLKYLKENGYTTIVMQDLLDYVNGGTLPEKPIMLTFDDGYYNNFVYAYPLLKKYESKMVLSPIGCYIDQYTEHPDTNASYAQANWDHLGEMMSSGLVELQNHSYNMHATSGGRKGCQRKKGESMEAYEKALTEDVMRAQKEFQEHLGYQPTTFTYPFGGISDGSLDILKKIGFQATLTCESRVNHISRNPECLYGLGRYIRTGDGTSAQYFQKILP